MNYSFIVPVANDDKLFFCIDSFVSATDSKDCECVIVCNGTADRRFADISECYKKFQNIRIVRCELSNIALARNLGIISATKEYIIWLDSDCVLDMFYITRLKVYHRGENIIRGQLKFNLGLNLPQRLNAWLRSLYYDSSSIWCWTPNLIIRRDIYDEVGLFFDRVSGAEDGEWDWRARDFNYRPVKYCSELLMQHVADPFQKTLRNWHLYGRGQAYRLKRDRLLKGWSMNNIFKNVFSDLHFLKSSNGFQKNVFLLCYTLIKALAFIKSWFFDWSSLTREKIIDQENFLRSKKIRDILTKQVKYAK